MWITRNKNEYKLKPFNQLTYVYKQKHVIQVMLDKHLFPIVKLFHVLQVLNSNFVVLVSMNNHRLYKNTNTNNNNILSHLKEQ
jgi:hypothetical protein